MSNREAFEKAWINFLDNLTIEQKCEFTIGMTKDINHIKYRIDEPRWQASRAQAIDECLELHKSIKVIPQIEDDAWIDAIIDSREAYQQALKQLKEQP